MPGLENAKSGILRYQSTSCTSELNPPVVIMKQLSKINWLKLKESSSLLLEKCLESHHDKPICRELDNPALSLECVSALDAASTNISSLKKILSDLIQLVAEGQLDYWKAFYGYVEVYSALYKRRLDGDLTEVCLWMGEGLMVALTDLKKRKNDRKHFPFLVKHIALLEKNNFIDEAIAVCDLALKENITDTSKNGYSGRRKRCINRLEKVDSRIVDWEAVIGKVELFLLSPTMYSPVDANKIKDIEHIREDISRLCNEILENQPSVGLDMFDEFKCIAVPCMKDKMVQEDEHQVRAVGKSYAWLLKELYKLEGCLWLWADRPVLMWYRDTSQGDDIWPDWLIRNYGEGRKLEYRLQGGQEPFNARELFYWLSNKGLTDWGSEHIDEILDEFDKKLVSIKTDTNQCFIRNFFHDKSYRKLGRIAKEEEDKLKNICRDLYAVGIMGDRANSILSIEAKTYRMQGNRFNMLYDFPAVKSSYILLPDISKFVLESKVRELLRDAENNVRRRGNIPDVGEGWISETQLYESIKMAFPKEKIVQHASPPWLGQQHFDIFFPEHNIAIEYQGIQHYEAIDLFGGNEGLRRTQERDERKRVLSFKNHCCLIYVDPGYVLESVVQEIELVVRKNTKF